VFKNLWCFLIAGFQGVLFCFDHLTYDADSILNESTAWTLYVNYRVPHHTLPSMWNLGWLATIVIPFSCLALFSVVKNDSRVLRLLGGHYLACLVLVAIGLSVYARGNIAAMRYYYFRYSDVMLLFMGYILALRQLQFWLDSRDLYGRPDIIKRLWFRMNAAAPLLALCASFLFASVHVVHFFDSVDGFESVKQKDDYVARQEMTAWIEHHTPEDAVFLVNPAYDSFYIEANRPVYVTFKHVPQTAANVAEWLKRLSLVSDSFFGKVNYFQAIKRYQEQYPSLNENTVRIIASQYDVSYFVTRTKQKYGLERVFVNSEFAVYRL
jgi:hypothetical protein